MFINKSGPLRKVQLIVRSISTADSGLAFHPFQVVGVGSFP